MSNLYLGNLNYQVTEKEIRELFEEFGEIESIKLFSEKGFGFVEMDSPESAGKALQELNGSLVMGREMKVDNARPKRETYPNRYKE